MFSSRLCLILWKTELCHTVWKNVIGSCEACFVGYDPDFGLSHLQNPDHKTELRTVSLGLSEGWHSEDMKTKCECH